VGVVRTGDRPTHHLNDEITATEEHQLSPFLMRTVERHIEPKPRAVERRGNAPGSSLETTTWSRAV